MELERKNEQNAESIQPPVAGRDSGAKKKRTARRGALSGRSMPRRVTRSKNGGKNTKAPPDLRPEYCQFTDEGCALAESCLSCPFSECIYDGRGGKRRWSSRIRDREMARLHIIERKKINELAEMFGVSERTVERAVRADGRGVGGQK